MGALSIDLIASGESPRTLLYPFIGVQELRKRAAIEALRLISVACSLSVFAPPYPPRSWLAAPSLILALPLPTRDLSDDDMSPRSGVWAGCADISAWGDGLMAGGRWTVWAGNVMVIREFFVEIL